MKRSLFIPIIVSSLLISGVSLGQSSSVLSSARELAKQGLQAYDAGRYEEAADKLAKAYQVVHVPTLAVNQARALVKLGKWVAASELYLEATRIPRDKTWQSTQTDAQKDAEREREELLPRIPRLTVVVKGTAPTEVEVAIDGTSLPVALIGTEQLQDPGVHKVQGTRGPEVVTEAISVREGDRANVTLQFKLVSAAVVQSGSNAPPPPVPVARPLQPTQPMAATAAPAAPPTAPATDSSSSNNQKLIGWIGIGAGGAGIVVGGITGLMAISKHSSLQDSGDCSGSSCTPAKKSDIDSLNGLRTVSTIGFVAGGVLAAAGVTLLLTAPKQEGPSVGLWLTPTGASLTGGF
jgi:hypothetical protein